MANSRRFISLFLIVVSCANNAHGMFDRLRHRVHDLQVTAGMVAPSIPQLIIDSVRRVTAFASEVPSTAQGEPIDLLKLRKELFQALDTRQFNKVLLLLQREPELLSELDDDGQTIMHKIADCDSVEESRDRLILVGEILHFFCRFYNPKREDNAGQTPSQIAAEVGHKALAKQLEG